MHLSLHTTLLLVQLAGPGQEAERARAWREDVRFLAEELERLHPRPFFSLPRPEFEAAVGSFESEVEGWDDERATAEFMRLVALVSRAGLDGHTAVWPMQVEYLTHAPEAGRAPPESKWCPGLDSNQHGVTR